MTADSTATARAYWVRQAARMARPVLGALAQDRLRATMPVEQAPGAVDRQKHSHLEAFGRLMAGIAPWLESNSAEPERKELADLAVAALRRATDPRSADFLNFCDGGQSLVDAAFLAQGILRAPRLLWQGLDPAARANVIAAMRSSRVIRPGRNNWLLFSATVEAFLAMAGESWDAMRVDYAIHQHEQWYKGDGAYGDGPFFHWDYYNSYVIHPMLLDVLAAVSRQRKDWDELRPKIEARATRYAAVQERSIAGDGSFAPIGRSLAYRGGAFHLLSQAALLGILPEKLPPQQVRAGALGVLRRTLEAPGTYDNDGWLRIGLCGHQPAIGEVYISTGSLYLASTIFLVLGLPPKDPFWNKPALPFTQQRVWAAKCRD